MCLCCHSEELSHLVCCHGEGCVTVVVTLVCCHQWSGTVHMCVTMVRDCCTCVMARDATCAVLS